MDFELLDLKTIRNFCYIESDDKPIDIHKNQLIMYDNIDGSTSFQYRISQRDTINKINIRMKK